MICLPPALSFTVQFIRKEPYMFDMLSNDSERWDINVCVNTVIPDQTVSTGSDQVSNIPPVVFNEP